MLKKNTTPSLTQKLYRADQVRQHEQEAAMAMGLDMFTLMQRAGEAVYQHSVLLVPNIDNYLVLAGVGNNAGDAFIAALSALKAGKNVTVSAVEPERQLSGDAAKAKAMWLEQSGKPVEQFSESQLQKAEIVIDGLLGTGVNGLVRAELASVIEAVNQSQLPVVSIDVPSGLCGDTGESLGYTIQADLTVTFVGIKLGLTTGLGKQFCGQLKFEELGIGKAFAKLARSDASALDIKHFTGLAPRPLNSHKGNHGRLLCIGGNAGMSGAIRMASEAALRTGAGLVKVYAHVDSKIQVCAGRPELMVISEGLENALEWADSVVLGPGLGTDEWAKDIFDKVMEYCQQHPKPIVIDADALNLKAVNTSFVALPDCIMTPHSGEASRLLNVSIEEIEANRFNSARQCAQRYAATCVLKGAGSIVDNQQHSWVCRHGNPGMATAGMGDVLTGILGALIAQGLSTDMACQFGVSLHAKAGDIVAERFGQRGLLASDLFTTVRELINE
jgi:NAD(P)H-hydrate epimerase